MTEQIGIIVVDHGSRRQESNDLLLAVVAQFQRKSEYDIVEPAHMELAEPSIQTAFDRCVERGANFVIVHPYFLAPGRHWHDDIPRLTSEAATRHLGVKFLVTAPLGLHTLMADIMNERITQCLNHARGHAEPCEICADSNTCRIQGVT